MHLGEVKCPFKITAKILSGKNLSSQTVSKFGGGLSWWLALCAFRCGKVSIKESQPNFV